MSKPDLTRLPDGIRQVDEPAPFVRRFTLNRPEKRNALSENCERFPCVTARAFAGNELRGQLLHALHCADQDPCVRVCIIRGAGKSFCAGYDLSAPVETPLPVFEAGGDGQFQRSVVSLWCSFWDLQKPIIAQVHGHCLAGGAELAAACDLIYVGESSRIGYPPVRSMGLPDTQIFPWVMGMRAAMELMLTGDSMTGQQAAESRWANRCYPDAELEAAVLEKAATIAKIPTDLLQFNKRSVHRAMEVMGMRTALRYGTDLQALSFHSDSSLKFMQKFSRKGDDYKKGDAAKAFRERDQKFGNSKL